MNWQRISGPALVAAGALMTHMGPALCKPTKEEAESFMRSWNPMGIKEAELNRGDPTDISKDRRVIAVVGITGGGKSSTCNSLSTGRKRLFEVASSLTSVTQSVSFRDYEFLHLQYRVIDTPGLQDTNRGSMDVEEELAKFARLAPHGVSAFVIVVPLGRVTAEHEGAVQRLVDLFGEGVLRHSLIAMTHAGVPGGNNLIKRDVILDQVGKLPTGHFLRQACEATGNRLVAVENTLEPHKQLSRIAVHQMVQDLVDSNGGAPMDVSFLLRGGRGAGRGGGLRGMQPGKCTSELLERGGKIILRVECEMGRA